MNIPPLGAPWSCCHWWAFSGGRGQRELLGMEWGCPGPLTGALRLNRAAGWGPGPLSQTPLGAEAGAAPVPGSPWSCAQRVSRLTPSGLGTPRRPPGTCGQARGSLRGPCQKELEGQPPSTLLRGKPASVHGEGDKSPAPRPRPAGPACPCPRLRPAGHLWEGGQAPGRFLGARTSGRTQMGPRGQLWAGPWLAWLPCLCPSALWGAGSHSDQPRQHHGNPTRLPVWAGVGTRLWLLSRGLWVLSGAVSFGHRGVCQGLSPRAAGMALSRGTVSTAEVRRCKLLPH